MQKRFHKHILSYITMDVILFINSIPCNILVTQLNTSPYLQLDYFFLQNFVFRYNNYIPLFSNIEINT